MISNLSDIAKNNGLALTDTDSTIVAEPSVPAEQPKEEEKKTPATYDDGGPFTTDANGNVYDRWGNEIWHNPVQTNNGKSVSGFQLVNTSDR